MDATDVESFIEALSQTHGNPPAHDVQEAMARRLRPGRLPREETEDGDPPSSRAGRIELLDIDGTLGSYDPSTLVVTVWEKGVAEAAARISANPASVRRIVRLHEWAHAVHHVGAGDGVRGSYRPDVFLTVSEETSDQIAQLAVAVSLRSTEAKATDPKAKATCAGMTKAFHDLMAHQSGRYRLPPVALDMPVPRLSSKLRVVLDLALGGMSPSAGEIERILD